MEKNLGNLTLIAGQSADAHYGLANTYLQLERMPDALTELLATLRLKPDHLAARVNLGNVLLVSQRVTEAIAQYELALKLAPDDPALRANLEQARLLQRSGPPPPSR